MFEVRTNAVRKIERQKRIIQASEARSRGVPIKGIASAMGLSCKAAQSYLQEARLDAVCEIPPPTSKKYFTRNCLCCGTTIRVDSPYRRCCSVCNTNARGAMV